VVLENGRGSLKLEPVSVQLLKSITDDSLIGFVRFDRPEKSVTQIMSSFALYGRAGGVAEILDEEAARRKFAVLRDVVEFVERIYQEELRKKADR
jgi:hypothetical protein